MMRRTYHPLLLMTLLVLIFVGLTSGAYAETPVVRAVLFYAPSCGHCHKVITEDLPPLFEKYGDQLQIIGVDASEASGGLLYDAAADKFGIAPEDRGVPLLIVAGVALIGSVDIPEQLPGLIEEYLAVGGTDWPDIPGLAAAVAQAEAAQPTPAQEMTASPPSTVTVAPLLAAPTLVPTVTPTATPPAPTATPGLLVTGGAMPGSGARFDRDPVGNGLAVVVLLGMLGVFGWVLAQRPWRILYDRARAPEAPAGTAAAHPAGWLVPLLSLIGLGVAGYLAYVETQQVLAVCGPVGDCNTVQQSAYARLFGVLPIGVLGVFGYVAILTAWATHRYGPVHVRGWAALALWALAAGGVLFSIYLTFLEPFVIGATCAWCLSSAVIMTLLLLIVTVDAARDGARVRALRAEGGSPAASS